MTRATPSPTTLTLGRALAIAARLEAPTAADGMATGVTVRPDERQVSLRWDAPIDARPRLEAPHTSHPPGERAGLDATATSGAFDRPAAGSFAALLRARMGALQYARYLTLPHHGRMVVPAQTGTDVAVEWRSENPAAPLTPSELETVAIGAQVRSVQVGLVVSRQLLIVSAQHYDVARELTALLVDAVANGWLRAAIQGTGDDDQPLGLLADSSVETVAVGENGGALTGAHCALLEEAVALDNADIGTPAWQTTPQVRRAARSIERFSGAGPLWTDANTLIGYPAFASTNVPSDLTKGTASEACSAMVFGRWEDLLMLTFGPGVDIVIDPYGKKYQGMVELSVALYCDAVPRRPTSFRKTLDITTS